MAAYIDVKAAIQEAEAILKEKGKIMDKLAIVRSDLRNAITMGVANPEQTKWIEEQFPVRERTTDPAEQLQKAEAKVQELRKKQQAPATKAA